MAANGRRSRATPRRGASAAKADTSWEHVAAWYDGWVGPAGSRYHRAIAIPLVLELLDPQPQEAVLDVGAGQGVLAPEIARHGARYTGVDLSPSLIDRARRHHGREGRFAIGDARRLDAVGGIRAHSFDAAVFLLSIQDMDPLDSVVSSVARVLRPTARIVIVVTHPAFRQPRHAGWGFDASRGLVYRRVDAYLSSMAVPMDAVPGAPPTRSFHRPISAYVNALAAEGFAIDAMREQPDLPEAQRPPGRRLATPTNAEIPLFLAIRARRG